jgi:HSP20 family protein
MDRLLSGFAGDLLDGPRLGAVQRQPAVTVWETGEELVAEMEVPGLKSDQIDISVVGGELSVKIDRPDLEQPGVTYHRRERPVGSFTRVVRLPVEVDAARVEADLRDGVLTIRLPKAASAKPRKIAVTSASGS